MPDAHKIFQRFENDGDITEGEVKILRNYACAQINSWSPNLEYYEEIYNELNELFLVIQWRKRNGLLAKGKRGEKVENDYVTFSFAR